MNISAAAIGYADFDDEQNLFTLGIREDRPGGGECLHVYNVHEGLGGLVLRENPPLIPLPMGSEEIIPSFSTYYAAAGVRIRYQSSAPPTRLAALPAGLIDFLAGLPIEIAPTGDGQG